MNGLRGYIQWVLAAGAISFGLWWLFVRDDGRAAAVEAQARQGSASEDASWLGHPQVKTRHCPRVCGVRAGGGRGSGRDEPGGDLQGDRPRTHEEDPRGYFFLPRKVRQVPGVPLPARPEFVDADTIRSPKERSGIDEHSDPGLEKPYYGYEFSNLEFRDGRTFAEIKEIPRSEWGDAVPLFRAFGFSDGKVINMSYGGELYETRLNWEWDPATLDVVEKTRLGGLRGWGVHRGPGEDADGNPVAGAEVWPMAEPILSTSQPAVHDG